MAKPQLKLVPQGLANLKRPRPEPPTFPTPEPCFIPDPHLAGWIFNTFINPRGPLANIEHNHLREATIGYLWANTENAKRGKRIIGTAQLGKVMGSDAWKKGQKEQQIREWFGREPDFLITLDADYCASCSDAQFCALIEHELYHCAQMLDMFGEPRFNEETGRPMWTMKGHDVEEFAGVVARYGAEATGVKELVAAASLGPTISEATLAGVCGLCVAA